MNYTFIKCAIVLIASSLIGATLKDVSYSIKQNGIMVNLDYTDAIDDDIDDPIKSLSDYEKPIEQPDIDD